jgi:hypothetical protein
VWEVDGVVFFCVADGVSEVFSYWVAPGRKKKKKKKK